MTADLQDVSALIAAWSNGNEQALSKLMPLLYPENSSEEVGFGGVCSKRTDGRLQTLYFCKSNV
jgi:hypothetical protein